MRIIKNSKELAKLVDKNKDLHLKDEDVRIEFEPSREELRDVFCQDLFLMDDNQRFNFNGGNFNGRDFKSRNFNGRNFNGRNFNGEKVSYYAFFDCYGSIECQSIEGRRQSYSEPICLDGKLVIKGRELNKKLK